MQVKTSIQARERRGGDLVDDLDVVTHNVLCRTDHSVRRVLVVIELASDGDLVRLTNEGTLLVGRVGWVSLEGQELSANASTASVVIPRGNTVDGAGLSELLRRFGVRASTPVAAVDEWTEEWE